MAKMEDDVVEKCQPKFYKRYVDNIINRRKKNQVMFNDLNNYHQKLTLELSTEKSTELSVELSIEVPTFRKRFNYFTSDSYDLNVVWKTKKVRSFFPLKDKNLHSSCKIYYGLCSCGEDYVGETKRNVTVR